LAAFGIGPSHAPAGYDDDDDDEEAANDDEETEDDVFSLFGVLMPTGEKIVIYIYRFSSYFFQCLMDLCSTCDSRVDKNLFMYGLYNCFMDIMLICLSIYVWMFLCVSIHACL
jgi:hypothetical protein